MSGGPAAAATERGLGDWRAWVSWRRVVVVWLGLVLASQVFVGVVSPDWYGLRSGEAPAGAEGVTVRVPVMGDRGPLAGGRSVELRAYRWGGVEGGDGGALPVVLLHGSPSRGGADFSALAPLLAAGGREVWALDRVGYGASEGWVPSYSFEADAWYVRAFMDAVGIGRAHLLGWSYSGAVVLRVAEGAPERVGSLSLVSSIGIQEGEGSGSYWFEHFKYGLGFPFVVALPEVLPHFGLFGPTGVRHAFIRDFWDSDQRPLRGVMEGLEAPTLVLHGRDDPLVPASTAEAHHRLIGPSRLVMLDSSHFFVMGEPMGEAGDLALSAGVLSGFFARHDEGGAVVRRGVVDFAPKPAARPLRLAGFEIDLRRDWWVLVVLIALLTLISEDLTVIAVGLAVGTGNLDFAVGWLGCMVGILGGDYGLWAIGRFGGTRLMRVRPFRGLVTQKTLDHWSGVLGKHTAKAVLASRMLPGTRLPMYIAVGIIPGHNKKFFFWMFVAVSVWVPALLLLTVLVGPPVLGFFRDVFHGPWAIVAAFVVLALLLRVVSLEATEVGRQRLKADIRRLWASEFWPRWVFYAPLVPWLVWLSLRHWGATVFTAANPGIDHGGGLLNEPKARITDALEACGAPVLRAVGVPGGGTAEERAAMVEGMVSGSSGAGGGGSGGSGLGGWPVVLKPMSGERGRGVRVIGDRAAAERYFETERGVVMAQRYHPGPVEVSVMWTRVPRAGAAVDEMPGEVFGVTRKIWPEVVGDGETTVQMLIWKHARYRMQAKVFLKRFEDRLDEVLAEGERLRLAKAGNHAQGTKFESGADMLTPALAAWTEGVMQAYRDPGTGGRIDFGRLDIRAESEEAVRRAEGLWIIELNGTLAESTDLYDPAWWIGRRYGALFRQWARLYKLGAMRRAEGHRALGFRGLARELIAHVRGGGGGGSD